MGETRDHLEEHGAAGMVYCGRAGCYRPERCKDCDSVAADCPNWAPDEPQLLAHDQAHPCQSAYEQNCKQRVLDGMRPWTRAEFDKHQGKLDAYAAAHRLVLGASDPMQRPLEIPARPEHPLITHLEMLRSVCSLPPDHQKRVLPVVLAQVMQDARAAVEQLDQLWRDNKRLKMETSLEHVHKLIDGLRKDFETLAGSKSSAMLADNVVSNPLMAAHVEDLHKPFLGLNFDGMDTLPTGMAFTPDMIGLYRAACLQMGILRRVVHGESCLCQQCFKTDNPEARKDG